MTPQIIPSILEKQTHCKITCSFFFQLFLTTSRFHTSWSKLLLPRPSPLSLSQSRCYWGTKAPPYGGSSGTLQSGSLASSGCSLDRRCGHNTGPPLRQKCCEKRSQMRPPSVIQSADRFACHNACQSKPKLASTLVLPFHQATQHPSSILKSEYYYACRLFGEINTHKNDCGTRGQGHYSKQMVQQTRASSTSMELTLSRPYFFSK